MQDISRMSCETAMFHNTGSLTAEYSLQSLCMHNAMSYLHYIWTRHSLWNQRALLRETAKTTKISVHNC